MLTVTCERAEIEVTRATQNETVPSDLEIMRRVRQIKSNWSASECVRRRREAENRLFDLMCTLGVDPATS
jgi:hypothetical protein